MKTFAWMGVVLSMLGSARAGDDVLVQVELIEVAHEKLTELRLDPELVQNAKKLRIKVQDLVRAKEAKVLHTMMLRLNGEKIGGSESCREVIYPTEFDPPESHPRIEVGGDSDADNIEQPVIATAFETRNQGEMFDVRGVEQAPDGVVSMQLAVEVVRGMGFTVAAKWKTPSGNEFSIDMPQFESLRFSNHLEVPDGGYGFGGVLVREAEPGKRVMVFVRCDTLNVGEEARK